MVLISRMRVQRRKYSLAMLRIQDGLNILFGFDNSTRKSITIACILLLYAFTGLLVAKLPYVLNVDCRSRIECYLFNHLLGLTISPSSSLTSKIYVYRASRCVFHSVAFQNGWRKHQHAHSYDYTYIKRMCIIFRVDSRALFRDR